MIENEAATAAGGRNGLSNSPIAASISGRKTGTSSSRARRCVRLSFMPAFSRKRDAASNLR